MLSSVLNSERAIQVNIAIMRTFVKFREMLATHKDLAQKLNQLLADGTARIKVDPTACDINKTQVFHPYIFICPLQWKNF